MRQPGLTPRPPRVTIAQRTILVDADGAELEATVTNVSKDGFRVRIKRELPVGAQVMLKNSRYGDVAGQIIWSVANEAGGIFIKAGNAHA